MGRHSPPSKCSCSHDLVVFTKANASASSLSRRVVALSCSWVQEPSIKQRFPIQSKVTEHTQKHNSPIDRGLECRVTKRHTFITSVYTNERRTPVMMLFLDAHNAIPPHLSLASMSDSLTYIPSRDVCCCMDDWRTVHARAAERRGPPRVPPAADGPGLRVERGCCRQRCGAMRGGVQVRLSARPLSRWVMYGNAPSYRSRSSVCCVGRVIVCELITAMRNAGPCWHRRRCLR